MPTKKTDPNTWTTKDIATQLADDKSTPIIVQKEGAKRLLEMLNNQDKPSVVINTPPVLTQTQIAENKKQEQILIDFYKSEENKKKTFWANEIQICNLGLELKDLEFVANKSTYYPQFTQNVPANLCMTNKKYLGTYINCQENPTITFEAKEAAKMTNVDFTVEIYDKYSKYNDFSKYLIYIPQSQVFVNYNNVNLAMQTIPNALGLSRDDYFLAVENLQNEIAKTGGQALYGGLAITMPPIFTGNTKIFTLQFLGSMVNSNAVAGVGQYNMI